LVLFMFNVTSMEIQWKIRRVHNAIKMVLRGFVELVGYSS